MTFDISSIDLASIVFYLFAALTVLSGVMVISARNSVHAVLFLIFAFFNAAALFVLIGAEYLAMTLVIVYVGAVAVLFLFVVMMMDVNFAALKQGFLRYLPVGGAVALLVFLQFAAAFRVGVHSNAAKVAPAHAIPDPEKITNTDAIGRILYTDYVYAFQIAGLILLVAMIGAIVLTLRQREGVRKQNITRQVQRTREQSVAVVKVKPGEGV